MIITQVLLAALSISAIALTQLTTNERWTRWAPILGLASQPFWFVAGWEAKQYGNLVVASAVTIVWLVGIYRAWFIPAKTPQPDTTPLPSFATLPCSKCGSPVVWMEGQDSNSTGEARFICTNCGTQEFRGGWASEMQMKPSN